MSARAKTSHQVQKSGEEEYTPPIIDGKMIFFTELFSWFLKWLIFDVIVYIIIILLYDIDIQSQIKYLGIANLIMTVFIILSTISGLTVAHNPMLYIQGTGAVEDMYDAKKRAYSFMFPLAVIIHAVVFLSLSKTIDFIIG